MARTSLSRKSLPLTDRDLEDLARLRESPVMQEALAAVAQTRLTEPTSESSLLHTVLVAGLRATQERAQEAGYAALGGEYRTDSERRHTAARRRRPSWADDA